MQVGDSFVVTIKKRFAKKHKIKKKMFLNARYMFFKGKH